MEKVMKKLTDSVVDKISMDFPAESGAEKRLRE